MTSDPPSSPSPALEAERAVLRQLAATLAYRAAKVLRDAPPEFQSRTLGPATRRPPQIVAHMADLMGWAIRMAQGEYVWKAEGGDDWNVEVERFFSNLATLDRELEGAVASPGAIDKLIQGPLSDALTH